MNSQTLERVEAEKLSQLEFGTEVTVILADDPGLWRRAAYAGHSPSAKGTHEVHVFVSDIEQGLHDSAPIVYAYEAAPDKIREVNLEKGYVMGDFFKLGHPCSEFRYQTFKAAFDLARAKNQVKELNTGRRK